MSLVSSATEEVTVAGVDPSLKMIGTNEMISKVVVPGEDNEEDGTDHRATALWDT